MFTYILRIIGEFQRTHGVRPQWICLNPRHMREFMEECPDLFDKETAMPLGFRIVIVPESELAHPKAMWSAPRRPKTRAPAPGEDPQLISWSTGRRHRMQRR